MTPRRASARPRASPVVADGRRPYLTDWGLVLDADFELTEQERAFYDAHRLYDYAELIACLDGVLYRRYNALTDAGMQRVQQLAWPARRHEGRCDRGRHRRQYRADRRRRPAAVRSALCWLCGHLHALVRLLPRAALPENPEDGIPQRGVMFRRLGNIIP